MLKEIHEAPYVINQVLNQDLKLYEDFVKAIKKAKTVYTIGSGTAGIAASQIAFYLRVFAAVNARSVIGADIYEYYDLIGPDDLFIAPSQSGETADVLEVLEIARKKGAKIAQGKAEEGVRNLKILSDEVDQYLKTGSNHEDVKKIAHLLIKSKDVFMLGKYQNFNIVREGMVKIIEGSYIHAHAIP